MQIQFDQFLIKKEREKERDQDICKGWREARKQFFIHQIPTTLNTVNHTDKQRELITQLFLRQKQGIDKKLIVNLNQYIWLPIFQRQIQQLQRAYNSTQEQYRRRERDYATIIQSIQYRYSALKVIQVEYEKKFADSCLFINPYSISAFELFKIINSNKQLSKVLLRGVTVQHFQQFIKDLRMSQGLQEPQCRQVKQSQSVELALEAKLQFTVDNQDQTRQILNDLLFFQKLFPKLSNITAKIVLGKWTEINMWGNNLMNTWKYLEKIADVRIQIKGKYQDIPVSCLPLVRKILFGGLVSLKQIAQLSFQLMNFGPYLSSNDLLAIEESLDSIFENNRVVRLDLQNCHRFPVFSQIKTIQSINLEYFYFRKKSTLLKELAQSSPTLKHIKCSQSSQIWKIGQNVFQQLQSLIVSHCDGVTVDSTSPELRSNIKSSAYGADFIVQILPKLPHLVFLQLWKINFSQQIIQSIVFYSIYTFTDQGLQEMDLKWPNIRYLKIRNCRNITANCWNTCNFGGLMEVQVDSRLLGEGRNVISYLKMRGIKVNYY